MRLYCQVKFWFQFFYGEWRSIQFSRSNKTETKRGFRFSHLCVLRKFASHPCYTSNVKLEQNGKCH